jgi:formate-dependent phosphoribosylglycinamide formyltransferase (GAR transformylase)
MRDVEAMMFGKPDAYPNRRLGIVFAPDVETATAARAKIKLTYASQ